MGKPASQIIDLLFGLQAEHGTTLVLITHDPQLAARCARTVKLLDGLIVRPRPGQWTRPGTARPETARPRHKRLCRDGA